MNGAALPSTSSPQPGTSNAPPPSGRNHPVAGPSSSGPYRRGRHAGNANRTAAHDQRTTAERGHRGKCWVVTVRIPDNLSDDDIDGSELVTTLTTFLGNGLDYLCFGVESGEQTGYRHLQAYAEFASALRIPQIKRILGINSVHLEPRFGTQQDAIDYCRGDFTTSDGRYKPLNAIFREFGVRHSSPTSGRSRAVEDLFQELKNGTPLTPALVNRVEITGQQFFQYHRAFKACENFFRPERTDPVEVHVRWGEPGSGKTKYAVDRGARILNWRTPFMLGYTGREEIVVIDDFNPMDMPRATFLQLTDRYNVTVEVKGDVLAWNPKIIYITSNFDPSSWYSGSNVWDQAVKRRLTTITHCTIEE